MCSNTVIPVVQDTGATKPKREPLTFEQQQIVEKNLNLVRFVLKKMHISLNNPEYDDYFQEGAVGLIKAVQSFNESLGFSLSSFAISYIHGTILYYMREKKNLVHIPRRAWDAFGKYKLFTSENPDATLSEIAEATGLPLSDLHYAISAMNPVSFDNHVKNGKSSRESDSHTTFADIIADSKITPEENFISEDAAQKAIDAVTESLASVTHKSIWLEWCYSALYDKPINQRALADKYHVSQAQISRILRKCQSQLVEYLKR